MVTGQPVANYRGHDGRVLCVLCSDNDDDVVFSGGQDNTLQCWRISEQKHVKPQPGKNGLIIMILHSVPTANTYPCIIRCILLRAYILF